MLYIITLFLLIVVSIIITMFMSKFTNKKLTNFLFIATSFICYLSLVVIVFLDVGINDWNFQNTLPIANISPFMFCILPIYYIFPSKLKKYFLTLIALLSIGMFLSPALTCIYRAVINYKFHTHFLLDFVAHFSLFLFGIYLVKSKQIELKIKDCLISSALILVVAIVMMVLNVIFDTSFFGLSLNGKHNIYNVVIVSNSFVNALIYFAGLISLLLIGFVFHKIINLKTKKIRE